MSFYVGNESKVLSLLENFDHCIADIRLWMTLNRRKLKDSKTDISYLSSSYNAKSITSPKLHIGESCNTANGSVRDLGIIIDTFFDMKSGPKEKVKQFVYDTAIVPVLGDLTSFLQQRTDKLCCY